MQITKKLIEELAHMSGMALTEDEVQVLRTELTKIVDYLEMIAPLAQQAQPDQQLKLGAPACPFRTPDAHQHAPQPLLNNVPAMLGAFVQAPKTL